MNSVIHRNVAILEVEDATVLDEIRAVLPLTDFVLGWLSETELVIDPRRVKELVENLERRGMAALVRRASARGE